MPLHGLSAYRGRHSGGAAVKPAPFTLHRPKSLDEALAILAEHEEGARPIAGGQSLVAMMNLRIARPEHLVDLSRIGGLTGIVLDGAYLRVGAMTPQRALLGERLVLTHAPLIAKAMPHVGHVQTRSRGTVGGSLAHADPAAELPLLMTTLRAEMLVLSETGERRIAAADFFEDALTTSLKPGELLTQILVPAAPADARVAFAEVARRHGDFAIAAAAVQWSPAQGRAWVGLGGVGPVPFSCATAEAALAAGEADADLDADLTGIDIQSDLQASADYRRRLAGTLLARCLAEVRPS